MSVYNECPFCGEDKNFQLRVLGNIKPVKAWVECLNCHAEGPLAHLEADAVARWNMGSRKK